MLLLLIMLEFGFAFNHQLTVGYATREGARTACRARPRWRHGVPGPNPDTDQVDQQIIAAAQRILKSPGSNVVMSDVQSIRIYKATATGAQNGSLVNVWTLHARRRSGP